jgi:hypothetical protein
MPLIAVFETHSQPPHVILIDISRSVIVLDCLMHDVSEIYGVSFSSDETLVAFAVRDSKEQGPKYQIICRRLDGPHEYPRLPGKYAAVFCGGNLLVTGNPETKGAIRNHVFFLTLQSSLHLDYHRLALLLREHLSEPMAIHDQSPFLIRLNASLMITIKKSLFLATRRGALSCGSRLKMANFLSLVHTN